MAQLAAMAQETQQQRQLPQLEQQQQQHRQQPARRQLAFEDAAAGGDQTDDVPMEYESFQRNDLTREIDEAMEVAEEAAEVQQRTGMVFSSDEENDDGQQLPQPAAPSSKRKTVRRTPLPGQPGTSKTAANAPTPRPLDFDDLSSDDDFVPSTSSTLAPAADPPSSSSSRPRRAAKSKASLAISASSAAADGDKASSDGAKNVSKAGAAGKGRGKGRGKNKSKAA